MAKSISFNAAGHEDWLDEINNKVNAIALERNCAKIEALKHWLDLADGKNIPSADNSELLGQIENYKSKQAQYESQIQQLQATIVEMQDAAKTWDNAAKWLLPPNMGSVCLALIMDDSEDFAKIKDVESACAFILEPYYRAGKFIADESDLANYKNALQNGIERHN